MDTETLRYAQEMIARKGYDEFTSQKVLDYIDAHDTMYGNIIDTNDVIDRISNNLNKNIEFVSLLIPRSARGGYDSEERKIKILVSDFGDSDYFHEMDHCATSDLSMMPDLDLGDAWELETIEKIYEKGYKAYSGIEISGKHPSTDLFSGFYRLGVHENEGITVLKQFDYSKLKGISQSGMEDVKIEEQGGYIVNYYMAEQMAYIIGRENLLHKHFYNDIDGIREDFSRYGIDYDKMLELSSKFMVTNQPMTDIESIERLGEITPDYIKKNKQIYQDYMAKAFIAKRCEELGIHDLNDYYNHLDSSQKEIELEELEKFTQFRICDSLQLETIRQSLQPELEKIEEPHNKIEKGKTSILQRIKDFFTRKKTKMLPEGRNGSRDEDVMEISAAETKPWDLENWGIDVEEFRQESYQIVQDSLDTRESDIQNETQIEGMGPWDMAGP